VLPLLAVPLTFWLIPDKLMTDRILGERRLGRTMFAGGRSGCGVRGVGCGVWDMWGAG
jgi:hypothetical protein